MNNTCLICRSSHTYVLLQLPCSHTSHHLQFDNPVQMSDCKESSDRTSPMKGVLVVSIVLMRAIGIVD